MIQSIFFLEGGKIKNVTSAQLNVVKTKNFVWVDVENPDKGDFDFLKKNFPLHSLACDPVFESSSRPRIIDFEKHLLIVFHEPILEEKSIAYSRLDIFLGKNFLITVHKNSLASIDTIKENLGDSPKIMKKGPSFLMYNLLDHVVDNYFPVLDDFDARADELESEVFLKADKNTLKKLFSLKRKVLRLRKRIGPQREVLAILSRHDSKLIDQDSIIYYRDVYDHLIMLSDMLDIYRDLLTSILDVYVSMQSNKLNEVMKVLTVIATIMMPLTLITGFYGMNIVFPEVQFFGPDSYFFIFFLMLILSVVMVLYFRKKEWL